MNGVNVDFFIDSNAILLDVLRDQAGSLGTKEDVTWEHVVAVVYDKWDPETFLSSIGTRSERL